MIIISITVHTIHVFLRDNFEPQYNYYDPRLNIIDISYNNFTSNNVDKWVTS